MDVLYSNSEMFAPTIPSSPTLLSSQLPPLQSAIKPLQSIS